MATLDAKEFAAALDAHLCAHDPQGWYKVRVWEKHGKTRVYVSEHSVRGSWRGTPMWAFDLQDTGWVCVRCPEVGGQLCDSVIGTFCAEKAQRVAQRAMVEACADMAVALACFKHIAKAMSDESVHCALEPLVSDGMELVSYKRRWTPGR